MRSQKKQIWIELASMLIVSGVIYLLFISQFGYYNDDWYSMYAARVGGSQTFHEMYSIDRPGRAYVMIPLYELFQGDPLYYNISAYVFRFFGAVSLLWLLRMLWPIQRRETFLIAFLFLIYPGFLSMPNAIDFQSHLIGVMLAFISIGLSILAIKRESRIHRIVLWLSAIITGWMYLSQMEYYIGFEAVRLLLFGLIVSRDVLARRQTVVRTLYAWFPYSIVPIFYLIWRMFFFNNERATTDAGLQLGMLIAEPLVTLYQWMVNFIQSFLNVTLLAWAVPLSQLAFPLDVTNNIRAILIAIAVVLVSLLIIRYMDRDRNGNEHSSVPWRQEMVVLGLLWAVVGLIVVILGNRAVLFPIYSRYGLVSAAGAIMVLVAGLCYIEERKIQIVLIGFLFFSASLTHYANGVRHAQEAQSLRTFWWQVSWRVPQIEQGSTIIVNYPNSGLREDSFVWGPANHIYYPYKVVPNTIQAGVYAILLNHDAVLKIQSRERQIFRKHIIVDTYRNYRNFVILSQPSPRSCVQVIDGIQPEYSSSETDSIMLIGSYSEVEHIVLDQNFKAPPYFLFGDEPTHDWCYFYEKAAYERQRGDWNAVIEIGEQASTNGFSPRDPIEWMPFLQAHARAGDAKYLAELAPRITKDVLIAGQVCENLKSILLLSVDVKNVLSQSYCISE